jgi:PPM family protein phosphatase
MNLAVKEKQSLEGYMDVFGLSEKGNREKNEDSFVAEKINEFYVLAVADGIGGHRGGEYASNIAVGELRESIKRKGLHGLKEGFINANATIYRENERRQSNMGTTLVACVINSKTGAYYFANVGDSRAYIFNKNMWKTEEHNLVKELLKKGIITEEEASDHPQRNIVTRALGLDKEVKIDLYEKYEPGSVVVLCSDGLSGFIDENDIQYIAKNNTSKHACELLIKIALNNGSNDNVTVIVGKNHGATAND